MVFSTPRKKRKFEKVTFEKTQIIILNHKHLNFYFSLKELNTENHLKLSDKNGVYLKDGIWRKDEIIQLTAPYVISDYGLLYYIYFCNQFLDKGNVEDKSEQFEITTTKLKKWLNDKFVTKRGANCFDGHEAFEKFTGKRNEENKNTSK